LAYSGGLDTSVILKWLCEEYGAEVVAFAADLGQGDQELDGLEQKARATGANAVYIDDLKEEFVRDYVFPALKANAVYEGTYLMGTSLARPLIARRQVEIARLENADGVAHGATGKGNDQVRFELSYMALNPSLIIVAPWREWNFKSRSDLISFARKYEIPITVTEEKPYSSDRNLLHLSFEGGVLEDPWAEPDESMYMMSVSPEKAPDKVTYVEIDFEAGVPCAINGNKLTPANLLSKLNELGGQNGVGRVDMVENRFVGMKSRGVYETPGGTILHIAHRALESITLDREVMHMKDQLIPRYAELVYNGFWFSPEMRSMQTFIDSTQEDVTGTVRIKLYKGNCTVAGRRSDRSLYHTGFATFEEDMVYDQKDAEGFIRLNGLRLKINRILRG